VASVHEVSCKIKAHVNPQAFLANTVNKDAVIVLLIETFQANRLIVTQALDDADTLVNIALQLASAGIMLLWLLMIPIYWSYWFTTGNLA